MPQIHRSLSNCVVWAGFCSDNLKVSWGDLTKPTQFASVRCSKPPIVCTRCSVIGGSRGSIQLIKSPLAEPWGEQCRMRLVCRQQYTRLPFMPQSVVENPVMALQLPVAMVLALLAGQFLTCVPPASVPPASVPQASLESPLIETLCFCRLFLVCDSKCTVPAHIFNHSPALCITLDEWSKKPFRGYI